MTDVNFLLRFRDAHHHIDRSLDARDRREFVLACEELRCLLIRLRDVLDTVSVSDIAAAVERHASATGS
jgi:hypothetical protein